MYWRIRLFWLVFVTACLLAAPAARAQKPQKPPTVEEIRQKIKEQEKQAEEEQDDSGECSLFWELFGESFKVLFVYAADADYPFGSHSMDQAMGEYLRIGYVNLCVAGAALREDRWGLSGRLAVILLPIHLHGFSQVLLDPTGSITVYAVNGGITLPFRRLILRRPGPAVFTRSASP